MSHPYTKDTRSPVRVETNYWVVKKGGCGYSSWGILPKVMKVRIIMIDTDKRMIGMWEPSMKESIKWKAEVEAKNCIISGLWPDEESPPRVRLSLQAGYNCEIYKKKMN